MNKNKRDGWSARRRNQRDNDRIARASGYADHRSMRRAENVEKLRAILEDLVPWAPVSESDCERFDTHEVADAVGSKPKVIRHLVFTRQLEPEQPRSEKSRKLFFRPSAIYKFLWSRRLLPGARALKSAVVANPRGIGGVGYTRKEAATILQVSTRKVDRYLAFGLLRRTAVSSSRLTLISSESIRELEELSRQLGGQLMKKTALVKRLARG